MEKFELRKFDLSTVAENARVIIVGKRQTGKTFLTRDLMFHRRDIPVGTVVSPTLESPNDSLGTVVPPPFIHAAYSPEIVENFERQNNLRMARMVRSF